MNGFQRGSEQGVVLLVMAGSLATLLLHGALIGLYLYFHEEEETPEEEPVEYAQYEEVELLMWGEVMPEDHQLPVIANPAPEEQPEEVVQIDEPPPEEEAVTPPPEEEEEPVQREEREETTRRDDRRHNPERPVNDEALVGSPDGFRGGTSLSPTALANLFGPVQEQIQNAYRPPSSLSAQELSRLSAVVRVYVNEDGRITRYRFSDRSGNSAFDSAVERALRNFQLGSRRLRLPFHNEAAMRQALDRGFEVTVRHLGQ